LARALSRLRRLSGNTDANYHHNKDDDHQGS
jgi:hypothetical protein